MPAELIRQSVIATDMSTRIASSNTVVASVGASETVVCQVTSLNTALTVVSGIWLSGGASLTVGTSGSAVTVRIRTGTTAGAGTVIATTGALTGGIAAGNLISQDIQGFDTNTAAGSQLATTSYCLTIAVTGASSSTVSQANLFLIVV